MLGWLPFWLCSYVIYQGAILPLDRIPRFLLVINDKLLHGTEFIPLFLFSVNAFNRAKKIWLNRHQALAAVLYCLFMALLTEFSQRFVPGRSASVNDAAADMIGAGVGFVFYRLALAFSHPQKVSDRNPV